MRHARVLVIWCSALFLLAVPAAASAQVKSAVIDFNSVNAPQSPTGEGLVVSELRSGNGISGDALTGHAGLLGTNPALAGNTALIFDATCTVDNRDGLPGDCSGEDADLLKPELGNVLIVAEDLVDANGNGRIDDPDDGDTPNSTLDFDLSTLEDGSFDVESLQVLDADGPEAGRVEVYRDGALVGTSPIPVSGDNVLQTIAIGATDVDRINVVLGGSGAVDNIRIRSEADEPPPPPPPGSDGCTPGYWKNHLDSWVPTGFAPSQALSSVFTASGLGSLASDTLLDALKYGGGASLTAKKQILLRAAVASLLNAAHADVDFGSTPAAVISAVNAALASNDADTILDLATDLDDRNNGGCTLN